MKITGHPLQPRRLRLRLVPSPSARGHRPGARSTAQSPAALRATGPNRATQRLLGPAVVALAAALSLVPSAALAQDLYIVGGTVHSVTGPAEVANVVIRGDRIVAVDPGATPGPGDRVIDAHGMIVTPGLVDFYSELGLVEIWGVADTVDLSGAGDEIRAAFRAVDGLNPQSTLIPVARAGGVTSVVTHPSGGLVAGQSVWWDLAGDRVGEMVVRSPVSMDLAGGVSGAHAVGGSRGAAALRLRELFADVDQYQRDPAAYNRGQMRDLSVSLLDLEALQPVARGDLPVFVDADRLADIEAALALTEELGLRLIVGGAAEAWAMADELAARGTFVVVHPLRNLPANFSELGARDDGAALLDRAGVPVILTTQSAHDVGRLRYYAGNAVRAGMDGESALAAVTLRPAEAAGLAADYGSVEVGKVANLAIWSGDPFELSTQLRHLVIRGEEVAMRSRQDALFQRYRHLDERAPGRAQGGDD